MTGDPQWEPLCLLTKDPTPLERYRAVRTVAAHARTAEELSELLDMLGLSATDGLPSSLEQPEPQSVAPAGVPAELLADLAAVHEWLVGS